MNSDQVFSAVNVNMTNLELGGADPKVIALAATPRVFIAAHDEGGGKWRGLWVLVKSYLGQIDAIKSVYAKRKEVRESTEKTIEGFLKREFDVDVDRIEAD